MLIGSMVEILEQKPPHGARLDENGLSAARQWSVLAQSDIGAILRMSAAQNLRRGVPYVDTAGNIPDPYCLCQTIEAVGRPAAVNGGVGQYLVTAEYSRRQTSPGAQPGGPVVWSRKASLTSKPVDIDARGVQILSSSLEPPDPPLTALLRDEVLHGEFYYAANSQMEAIKVFRQYEGKINAAPISLLGMGAKCVMVHPFEARETDTGWVFMSVDLECKPPKTYAGVTYGGWVDVFPDRGRRAVVDATATDVTKKFGWIKDGSGVYTPSSYPLDGTGRVLSVSSEMTQPGGITIAGILGMLENPTHLIAVDNYLTVDFAAIPFPK